MSWVFPPCFLSNMRNSKEMRFLIWTYYGALQWFKWAERQLWCFLYIVIEYFILLIWLAHTLRLWQCSLIQTALYVTHSSVFNFFSWLVPEKHKKREEHKMYKTGPFFNKCFAKIKQSKTIHAFVYTSLWTIQF